MGILPRMQLCTHRTLNSLLHRNAPTQKKKKTRGRRKTATAKSQKYHEKSANIKDKRNKI